MFDAILDVSLILPFPLSNSGIGGLVAQQHIAAFFGSGMGISPGRVRVVWPQGTTTNGKAFVEFNDYNK